MQSSKPTILAIACLLLFTLSAHSQSVGINTDNSSPHGSAMLDVKSAEKGILFPRISNATMVQINDPADGLIIYNTDEKDLFIHVDGNWNPVGSGGASGHWLTTNNGIFYNNRVGIGTNALLSKFNIQTGIFDQTGKSAMIENYYGGPVEKHGLNIFLSQEGSGQKYGLKSLVAAHPSSTTPAYGVHSLIYPNGTPNPVYAIYGEVQDDGPGEKWAGYFKGDTRVSKMLRVGEGSGFETGLFRVMNEQEATAAFIRNAYTGTNQANGLHVNVQGSSGNQTNVNAPMNPNSDATKSAVAYSTSLPFFGGGGAVGKDIIGFQASMTGPTQGIKYGIKITSPGASNWAGHLDGKARITEKTFIGSELGQGALNIYNDGKTTGIANLDIQNSYNSWYGIRNTYTAATGTELLNFYGARTDVLGGEIGKNIYGHFINLGPANGNKTGLYVNAPGVNNWATFSNGRSYISEELLIGTLEAAAGYQLSVDGKIACEEVRVEMSDAWPDYVFQKDYSLLALEEVEKSIESNGHLPGIPSAKIIENEGMEIGEMQRLMMEKIEELTLYIIELNKENKELSNRLSNLENK